MSNDADPRKGWTADRVREHLQNAVYLEMWTVPLYLTAAYSLDVPINEKTNRPEFLPVPMKDGKPDFGSFTQTDYNQYAFNNILSVAIQEMLHVELAANLLNAVRPTEGTSPVTFTGSGADPTPPRSAPKYDKPPACLSDDVLPDGVKLRLGPFDTNQAQLFRWVESEQELPPPPYDVEAWHATYNSIGHFYTSLMFGVKACWADLYPAAGRAQDPFQRDDWEAAAMQARGGQLLKLVFHIAPPPQAAAGDSNLEAIHYPDFSIKIYGAPDEAGIRAQAAMTAIMVQGEGAGGTQDIPVEFQPTGDPEDAIEVALDKVSHWERFDELVGLVEEGKFSYVQPVANPDPAHFEVALNQSYTAFLSSLNDAFSNNGSLGVPAMAGLGNRTLQAWQNQVKVEDMFEWVDSSKYIDPSGSQGYHACQGLDPQGTSQCATAFYHACSATNLCKGQGGCGAKINSGDKDITWLPNKNECRGKGNCGAPIPAGQCFDKDGNVPMGDNVWKYARKLMNFPTDEPKPNDLRTSLTSTSSVKCNPGEDG
ncbi:MAG TPA: ferritin-like domain-containing protein [Pyrinomonadaceae bacterium]|nr:ferritin-like domain-containing protein [Pyrinomonadaceae bacterium]